MATDGWATFGKGMFVLLAVAGGVWIGRGGQLPPLAELSPRQSADFYESENHRSGERRPGWSDAESHRLRVDDSEPANRLRGATDAIGQRAERPDVPHRDDRAYAFRSNSAETLPPAPEDAPVVDGADSERVGAPLPTGQLLLANAAVSHDDLAAANTRDVGPPVVTKIESDGVTYGSTQLDRGFWIRSVATVKVHLNEVLTAGHYLYIVSDIDSGNHVKGKVKSDHPRIWEFPEPNSLVGGKYKLISATEDDKLAAAKRAPDVTLQIATTANTPEITHVSNNKYSVTPKRYDENLIQAPDGYLKLNGNALPGRVVHLVAESALTSSSFVPTTHAWQTTADGSGRWTLEISLPRAGTPGATGRLLAYALDNNLRAYADQVVKYESVFIGAPAITLTLDGVKVGQTRNGYVNPFRTNTKQVHVHYTYTDSTAANTDLIVLKVGGSPRFAVQKEATTASPLTWDIPSEGLHPVKLAVYRGDKEIAESSETVVVDFRQHGPKAQDVVVVNPLMTPNNTLLRVQFDANNPPKKDIHQENFALTRASRKDNIPAISSVEYVEADSTLLITLNKVLESDAYTLTIKPKASGDKLIQDAYGNLLNATPQKREGTDATLHFFKTVGTELPSQTRGLSGIKAPHIEYEEYTQRRTIPEGFNPSDKVVTRVARLYYYRDAHRVVQLLNRTAQSYNRAAVDQQQQLADHALRDAQNTTSDRRFAEQEAVRAAQRSRAAESALTQAQAALAQSQAQHSSTGDQLTKLDRAIEQQRSTVTQRTRELEAKRAELTAAQQSATEDTDQKEEAIKNADAAVAAATKNLAAAEAELQQLRDQKSDVSRQQTDAATRRENARRLVDTAMGEVQSARQEELRLTDNLTKLEAKEERDFRTLFIREVAAAKADPDTFAPGKPNSDDPIAQVSLSVIGEGEIQLRGPLKGVNLARTLINQIDAPVGQVRVAIHTVQVNGERGERMEPVVERIQRSVDHSRFLTSQSAQMLRHAVTQVAARRAEMVFAMCEGLSQHERDQKYLHAFFGRDFVNELHDMDSEFLRTDNKLLSLHSMDSTSLAQALFLLALARNDVRMEILQEFEDLTTLRLPLEEQEYFSASSARYKFGPLFHKQKFQFLGHNARFVSLRGHFNAEVAHPDTITPIQREFLRLAQIFKSRLVAEREILQRVMERSLIEDRFETNYLEQLRTAYENEKKQEQQVRTARALVREKQSMVNLAAAPVFSTINQQRENSQEIRLLGNETSQSLAELEDPRYGTLQLQVRKMEEYAEKPGATEALKTAAIASRTLYSAISQEPVAADYKLPANGVASELWNARKAFYMAIPGFRSLANIPALEFSIRSKEHKFKFKLIPDPAKPENFKVDILDGDFQQATAFARSIEVRFTSFLKSLDDLQLIGDAKIRQSALETTLTTIVQFGASPKESDVLDVMLSIKIASDHAVAISRDIELVTDDFVARLNLLMARIQEDESSISRTIDTWEHLKADIFAYISKNGNLYDKSVVLSRQVDVVFEELVRQQLLLKSAEQLAQESRRPLDDKKFLDMLVDDAEDKYIEILEGTRAHTANVDNYLARVITALDDDFNTQFYHPTFKHVREAGRFWDVQLGQIETTTVLTNNRTFAKVSPQAMMEFDLPKRDILINEAFESAAAAFQDYGALLHDPTFLSLTKMYRGQPASAVFGGGLPNPLVRDVLPGLPSQTNEQLMIQLGATAPDFPSALESLIPDPAIYKFETGTGFEIRPVIQPDGQAVVFHLNYMYTTNLREPVRADEKHLGRIKRHFVDTDVTLGNFELREVSKYTVALKASRTARGVPLLEDVPVAGILFRPLPQQQSSLQQNLILSQATIFPTLFDLMGLRWAPAVADLGVERLRELDFVTQGRRTELQHRVFDTTSQTVDQFLRIPEAERRPDLYRSQEVVPRERWDGRRPLGLNKEDLTPVEPRMVPSEGGWLVPHETGALMQPGALMMMESMDGIGLPPSAQSGDPSHQRMGPPLEVPGIGMPPDTVIELQSYRTESRGGSAMQRPRETETKPVSPSRPAVRIPGRTPGTPLTPPSSAGQPPRRLPDAEPARAGRSFLFPGPAKGQTPEASSPRGGLQGASRLLNPGDDDAGGFSDPQIQPLIRGDDTTEHAVESTGQSSSTSPLRWFRMPWKSSSH